MNFKWLLALVVACVIIGHAGAVVLCGAVGPRYVSIAAGWVTGVNYSLARIIADVSWKHLKDKGIKMAAETSGGSVASAKLIGSGDTDFAILHNDIAAYAYKGQNPLFEKSISDLQGVCSLFSDYVQLVAREDAEIDSVADLKGKRVAIGPDGSGGAENAKQILAIWGLDLADLSDVAPLDFEKAMLELQAGRLDAVFTTTIAGFQPLSDLARLMPLEWVPIAGPPVDQLIERQPLYARRVIPAGTYAGNAQDVATVSLMSLLAVRKGLEPDIVYAVLSATYADLDPYRQAHAQFRDISPATGLTGMSIPLHPGAEKFFAERGLLRKASPPRYSLNRHSDGLPHA